MKNFIAVFKMTIMKKVDEMKIKAPNIKEARYIAESFRGNGCVLMKVVEA